MFGSECSFINGYHRGGHLNRFDTAVKEGICADIHQGAVGCKRDLCKTPNVCKSIGINRTNTRRDLNGRESRRVECSHRNTCQPRAQLCRAQIGIRSKYFATHGCHAVGDHDAFQRTELESATA